MRTAMMMLSESAALVQTAWPSSMPSASVSLMSLLRRRGSASARRKRSALQSLQLSPASVERINTRDFEHGKNLAATARMPREAHHTAGKWHLGIDRQVRIGHALPA